MRALAILGPNASAREALAFDSSRCKVSVWDQSEEFAADAALVFGGDGTVHRHLPALSRAAIPVLVVPHGSGNDFARALGIVNRSQAGVAWRRFCSGFGVVRTIDLGVIRTRDSETLFACVASAGLDAEANRRANKLPRWLRARGGYLLAGLRSILSFRPHPFGIRMEGRGGAAPVAIADPGLLVACANTPFYGDGLRIAPEALLDDGLLDVCFVGAISRPKILLVLRKLIAGTHTRLPEVQYFKTKSVRLEPESPLPVFADGEYVCDTPVDVSVREKALRVIT